ncbi:TRAF type zinc finger protein, putative [Medicago truncatula]|uniref:TRAF type zinc finger protein, putative n=1 Tax=Medicago truncatula TaxID=3880 RepID=G7J400_MEDTR|nr:TRAF type zinc finger protein, putative [Medicago truncatula]
MGEKRDFSKSVNAISNLFSLINCETMDCNILYIHECESCPQRIVTCEFCEFPLPAIDLPEHQTQ